MSLDIINDAWKQFNLYGSFEMEKLGSSSVGNCTYQADGNAAVAGTREECDKSRSHMQENPHLDGEGESFDKSKKAPTSSPLCISTKTKISFLNTTEIEIMSLFWKVPILDYYLPNEGVIKKQMKVSSHSPEETKEINKELEKIRNNSRLHFEETIIDTIDTTEDCTPGSGKKYKLSKKVSVGICKKNIANQSNKQKRAFFNCIVLILRIYMEDDGAPAPYKEIHVKIFNTGKMEIPGIQSNDMYNKVMELIVSTLSACGVSGSNNSPLACEEGKSETVLINSNFNCGFYIERDEMYSLLKYKYRIHCNFDSCSYPGIQCKFYYDKTIKSNEQTGTLPKHKDYLEISFMIFRTGSVLIVGKCESEVLFEIYDKIKEILTVEYEKICNTNIQACDKFVKKEKIVKYKTVYIYKEKEEEQEQNDPEDK